MSAVELLERLDAREISSVEATRAFIARIEAHDGRINAIPVRRFEAALAEAEAADTARARGGEVGALCGLPLTVKENFELEGFDVTLGLTARRHQPAPRDAVVVGQLRRAGAVVLGKTNVPQLLLAQETENAIWGTTRNPWNTERTPGGSSGGEAAAIAAGMTPCGVGTDIGGSIRIPAHFSGVFGLKPTLDRWSCRGAHGAIPGQEVVRAQTGPMGRSTADLALLLLAADPVAQARVDPRVAPLPFEDPSEIDLRGRRIGYYEDDGFLAPTPAIRRAVQAARDALADAGATLVPFTPPDQGEVVYLWLAAISGDGGRSIDAKLGGEAPSPQLKPSRLLLTVPAPARKALATVLGLRGEKRLARLLRELGEKSVADLWRLTERRTALRWAELDAWNAAQLDAVICPPHSVPAMGHRLSGDFTLSVGYAFRYSLLDFPAGVAPVTRVRPGEASPAPAGADRVEKKQAAIDADGAGLPVGVQVVGRPYREDVVLAAMAAIEARVRPQSDFPRTPIDPVGGRP